MFGLSDHLIYSADTSSNLKIYQNKLLLEQLEVFNIKRRLIWVFYMNYADIRTLYLSLSISKNDMDMRQGWFSLEKYVESDMDEQNPYHN